MLAQLFITISSLFIIFVIYTLFFGDTHFHEKGLIGKFSRFLGDTCDVICGDKSRALMRRFLGEKCCGFLERTEDYVCLSRNPLMPAVYVAFVLFGFSIFLVSAWPLIGKSELVSEFHKFGAIFMVGFCFTVFGIALTADPGKITPSNAAMLVTRFPYDNLLYSPGECKTCKTPKPARSKHCRICNHCVSRFDHHCPWLNNCIGENNIRFFLLFLLSHAMLCMYGACLITMMMIAFGIENNIWYMHMYNAEGQLQPITVGVIIQFILYHHSTCVCLGLALLMISLVLFGFLAYHLYLIVRGTTTNETYKWKDLSRAHAQMRMEINKKKEQAAEEARKKYAGEKQQVIDSKVAEAVAAVKDDIPHIYNRYNQGAFSNLIQALFPPQSGPTSMREKAAQILKNKPKKAGPRRSGKL